MRCGDCPYHAGFPWNTCELCAAPVLALGLLALVAVAWLAWVTP
jgi:hypothetical protein